MNEDQKVSPFGGDLEGANRHTEDMQEIITKVPSWIMRWGIMVFFGILLMVAAIGAFVRYPDTIKAGLRFESTGVSMPVVAPVGGMVTNVPVKQEALVKKGQVLAAINGPAGLAQLVAPQDGEVGFVALIEPGAGLRANQVVFIIHPQHEQFFGVMEIPAANINKIKVGQQVLISLRNYPPDKYDRLKGYIDYIANEPGRDGSFIASVKWNSAGLKQAIPLKSWMTGDAEIITEDVSVLKRITASLFKLR